MTFKKMSHSHIFVYIVLVFFINGQRQKQDIERCHYMVCIFAKMTTLLTFTWTGIVDPHAGLSHLCKQLVHSGH